MQSKAKKLHLLVSSRREQDIEDQFDSMAATGHVVRVILAGRCVDADIESYIDGMVFNMIRWDLPTRARVKKVLVADADGMYVLSIWPETRTTKTTIGSAGLICKSQSWPSVAADML